jgi:site-specific DNA recombinase
VHETIGESPRKRAMRTRAQTPALLKGLIFGPTGAAMTPAHTRRNGKLYRYYVSTDVLKRDADSCPIRRVPAGEIESAVIDPVARIAARAGDRRAHLARDAAIRRGDFGG